MRSWQPAHGDDGWSDGYGDWDAPYDDYRHDWGTPNAGFYDGGWSNPDGSGDFGDKAAAQEQLRLVRACACVRAFCRDGNRGLLAPCLVTLSDAVPVLALSCLARIGAASSTIVVDQL